MVRGHPRLRTPTSDIREEDLLFETFVAIALLGLICWAVFRHGKQVGSRLGYGVGRIHGRRP
jgi:hypothetical protein